MAEAKTSQEVLEKVRYDYEVGNYKTITELANRYGINNKSLFARIDREDWEASKLERLRKTEKALVKKAVSLGEEYLLNSYERAKKYEKLIDVSQKNLGSRDDEDNPILDPDAINTYTLAESRIHEIAKSSLRIPDIRNLDVTSKGQSIGESLVSALQKLRETDKTPKLTDADCDRILEAEIVDENSQ